MIERRTDIHCYSPTFTGCHSRASNYFMMPEIVMSPALFMVLSPWKRVLTFDKPIILRETMTLSRKGMKCLGAGQFSPGECSCPPISIIKPQQRLGQVQNDISSWHQRGKDSGMGLSLLEPGEPVVIVCQIQDKNSGYYITCFQNILVGWGGCSSSRPLLPGRRHSTRGSGLSVVGQADQAGPSCRSCPAQNIFFSLHFCCLLSKRHSTLTASFDTLSDTPYGYCTLTFNYVQSYYNHFLITNPL